MSSHDVGGVRLPDAVGGHPALDFCNTRAGWGDPQPKEYLTAPGVLGLWAYDNGLLPAPPAQAAGEEETLARALALREALYGCALHRGTPEQWRLVTAEAVAARTLGRLAPGGPGEPARWLPPAGAGPAATALALVATAAEDLLTSSLAPFVAACPGEGCGWLFADRRGRRRWCSMAACGNRAKARRHAERRSTGGDDASGDLPAVSRRDADKGV